MIQALDCENVMNEENEAAESNGLEASGWKYTLNYFE